MENNKPCFQKHLSPTHVWALAFGCVIGWGAFIGLRKFAEWYKEFYG